MSKLLSLIIPSYNTPEILYRSMLESILQLKDLKEYKDIFEVILINDGATDNTPKILEEYIPKFNEISEKIFKVITTKNQGNTFARNIGLDQAQGKFVTFLDCDDSLKSDWLEFCIKLIENKSIGGKYNIIQFNHYRVNLDALKTDYTKLSVKNFQDLVSKERYEKRIEKHSQVKNPRIARPVGWIFVWNKLYKKDFLDKNKIRFNTSKDSVQNILVDNVPSKYIVAEDNLFNEICSYYVKECYITVWFGLYHFYRNGSLNTVISEEQHKLGEKLYNETIQKELKERNLIK